MVLEQVVVDHRHRLPRHPASPKYWMLRQSYFAKSFKGSKASNSSVVGTMSINLRLLDIRTTWGLSLPCSTRRRRPWMWKLGFIQSNPSFLYSRHHVRKKTRLISPCNNFTAQHVSGGSTTLPCFWLIMWSLGTNSKMCSESTIFLKVSWKGN